MNDWGPPPSPRTPIRGAALMDAVIADLLSQRGMRDASEVGHVAAGRGAGVARNACDSAVYPAGSALSREVLCG